MTMFDTVNLRNNANFKTMISKDLFWVPVNCLGQTHYTSEEIHSFVQLTPYEKQNKKLNLYEAIQLFQLSGFKDIEDVILLPYNDNIWEHHKPGYHAIRTNYGCCSSIAAWLSFILRYSYERKGYLLFNRPDGSGHVMNYFYINNRYYIVDLSTMTAENSRRICIESGKKADYIYSSYATSILFETIDPCCFSKYHNRLQKTRGFDFLYYIIEDCEYIPPLFSIINNGCAEMICSFSAEILHYSNQVFYTYEKDAPNYSPNWNCY